MDPTTYVFCVDLRTNSGFFSLYSFKLSVFITEAQCFLCGTNWVFKLDGYSFVLKGLNRMQIPSKETPDATVTYYSIDQLLAKLGTHIKEGTREMGEYHTIEHIAFLWKK